MSRNTVTKVVTFLIGGGVAAIFNLVLIALLIERFGFNTPLLRNVANAIAIELSLTLSFFIYRIWVWKGGVWTVKDVLLRQLPLYHLAAGTAVALRLFLIFPVLDWLGVHYKLNTLVGILASASINYLISDRFVFKENNRSGAIDSAPRPVYPEGLEAVQASPLNVGGSAQKDLLSLVMPAYNEEGSVGETICSIVSMLRQHQINHEILVVNDNSKDGTESVLQYLSQTYPEVRYVNSYYPNGFGFAVRCGLENFEGDAVAIVMADGSDSAEDILKYYQKLHEGYDCVFGSRFVREAQVIDYPVHKLIVNRMANLFIQILFGLSYNDTTNAFKLYRREAIEGVSPLISHHFNLTVEIPLKAIVRGYSYSVVPITWQNRKSGISKLKIREMGSRYLFIVLSILLERWLSRGDYVRKTLPNPNRVLNQRT